MEPNAPWAVKPEAAYRWSIGCTVIGSLALDLGFRLCLNALRFMVLDYRSTYYKGYTYSYITISLQTHLNRLFLPPSLNR